MRSYENYRDSKVEWLGSIPAHWDVRRTKANFSFRKGLSITKADLKESGIAVISYGQVHSKINTGVRLCQELIRYVDESYLATSRNALVERGDFIFADTSEDIAGCGNCAYVDWDGDIFAGYHTIIAHNKETNDNKYFAYLFQAPLWRSQIRSVVNGVKVYSITQEILKSTYIIVPPKDEQDQIARFLDWKITAIDKLIAIRGEQLTDLADLRKALITREVTRGNWERVRAKRFVRITNGSRPTTEGNIPVYGSGKKPFATCGEYKIGPAVLLGRKGSIDNPVYVDGLYWNVDTAFDVKPLRDDLSIKYYYYLATQFDYGFYMTKTAIPSMTQTDYYNMYIPVPPISEQIRIANYFDEKCTQIDSAITNFTQ